MPFESALPPGSTIGILGGGQLGRMLALAAARLGLRTHIFCPDPDSPAFEVTPHRTVARYDDEAALAAFVDRVDVVTYEFENVPVASASLLADLKPLRPGVRALAVAQDRLAEKTFLSGLGIAVAPFRPVSTETDLEGAIDSLGLPAVLKTTRLGYDGKGQSVLRERGAAAGAFAALSPRPLVLEAFVPFVREISVVVARGLAGELRAFEPAENTHRDGILRRSRVPATGTPALLEEARETAARIAVTLDYVGVLGVEFFVAPGEALLVNEIAPRVHNSGHWTEAVCVSDQFEQHIRAVAGWPLGDPIRLADAEMENLIGNEVLNAPSTASGRLHLYGKADVRAGRKMGHVTRIFPLGSGNK